MGSKMELTAKALVCHGMMKAIHSFIPSPKLLVAGTALVAVGLFSSCTTVQLSDDGSVVGEYKLGYLIAKPGQSLERVHTAVTKAFKDLGYLQVGDKETPGEIELSARDAHDTLISVELKDFTTYTSVRIRCGVSGGLAQEQQVYHAIAQHF
ncbi:MAG TPA: DUF3568 family protein [Opitutaceae bacterium]|nr:DUF3568 family protein [Opitutaceae bacterium]